MTDTLDVTLVVPAYNERATIASSIAAWLDVLAAAGLTAHCVVVDDGSTDGTDAALAEVAGALPHVKVLRQANAGHGAALLRGYRAATGAWVLQVDGDDEIGPRHFGELWAQRTERGLVLGRRTHADRAFIRRCISRTAAAYVRLVSGARVHDANVPYRLLPRTLLVQFLASLPDGTVAPNLAMTIFAGLQGWEVREVAVVERPRVPTRRPLGGLRLWRTVLLAFSQSRRFRDAARQSTRS